MFQISGTATVNSSDTTTFNTTTVDTPTSTVNAIGKLNIKINNG